MIFAQKRPLFGPKSRVSPFFTVFFYTSYYLVALQLFAIFAKYGHS